MRIIGYLDFPGVKTTVFKMDNRVSIKFETGLYEQIYKFREGEGADTLEDIRKIFTEPMIKSVMAQFQQMHTVRNQGLAAANRGASEEVFDEIY